MRLGKLKNVVITLRRDDAASAQPICDAALNTVDVITAERDDYLATPKANAFSGTIPVSASLR